MLKSRTQGNGKKTKLKGFSLGNLNVLNENKCSVPLIKSSNHISHHFNNLYSITTKTIYYGCFLILESCQVSKLASFDSSTIFKLEYTPVNT